jgi:hypothetical protein
MRPNIASYKASIDYSTLTDAERGLGTLSDDAWLAPILKYNNIRHLLLPKYASFAGSPTVVDYDHALATRFQWTAGRIVKSASDAAWNSHDVFSFIISNTDLHFDSGTVPVARTVIVAAAFNAAGLSATSSFLFSFYSGASGLTNGQAFHQASGIVYIPAAGSSFTLPAANVPAADVPAVYCADYDGVNTAHWYVNDPVTAKVASTSITGTPLTESDPSYGLRVGNGFGGSLSGFQGKMGPFILLEGVASAVQRADTMNAIKTRFAIS